METVGGPTDRQRDRQQQSNMPSHFQRGHTNNLEGNKITSHFLIYYFSIPEKITLIDLNA